MNEWELTERALEGLARSSHDWQGGALLAASPEPRGGRLHLGHDARVVVEQHGR